MRKVIVSEFVSLDGVIETPSWSIQLTGEEQQKYKLDELSASDSLLLGRATYEELAAQWPHLSERYGGYTDMMNTYPKYVVSTTLQEPLEWNAALIEGDVAEEILRLKREPGKDILVYGSGDLVGTLMQHNLADEYRLMVFPVVVGGGKRLFKDGGAQIALELVDSKTFSTGVVYLTYRPARERDDNDQKEIEAGSSQERTTLVLGGTGKTGRRVVERSAVTGHAITRMRTDTPR